MKQLCSFLCVVAVFVAGARLFAEQEVTLKSGASFIGEVSLDGDVVVVQVDEAKLRVPLSDVAAISPLGAGHEQQAQRLLMTALESKLMNNSGREVLAILAEAARLDPKNPKIAYWYASTLAEAGFGKAANEVFAPRRDDIANAYPGMADLLAARIEERLELEKMPAEVVERIDRLTATAGRNAGTPEWELLAAVLRLVDQNQRAIERSAFRIHINGQEEKLESFHDGYYLFSYKQNRQNQDPVCRLEINQPGLEPTTFEFTGDWPRVRNVGELVVERYDENSKRLYRAHVVGPNGQPVAEATLTLTPVFSNGSTSSNTISGDTDADGRVELLAFPMKYSYMVRADGFNSKNGTVELSAGSADSRDWHEQQVKLDHAIRATIRVAWLSTAFPGGGTTSDETTLQVSGDSTSPNRYPQNNLQWLRASQTRNRLTLQFVNMPYGYQGPNAPDVWVRVVDTDASQDGDADMAEQDDANAADAAAKFKALDLEKIASLKEELEAPPELGQPARPGYAGPMIVRAAAGNIYVGRLSNRDTRTGQPVQIDFKVFVEKLTGDSAEND